MNKYYQRSIIERFMTKEQLASFDAEYKEARVPKVFSKWGTEKDRSNYINFIKSQR